MCQKKTHTVFVEPQTLGESLIFGPFFNFSSLCTMLLFNHFLVFSQLSEEYAKYFRFLMGRHKKYFAQFVLCELLNVMTVGINFWITDIFLSRKFSNYGSSVIQYHMLTDSEQESIRNPRCNVFPTTVSFIKKSSFFF